ncbi:MAG: alkaline phosphatase family protein [Cytophagaceae bacterium]|nr:alkaline phosphatase family protein [Gemmatimonadaceae bacterium]
MKRRRVMALALVGLLSAGNAHAQGKTRNVVLIVTDGLRWQEVFRGAERALVSRNAGGVRDTTFTLRTFWRADVDARRRALLPFFWERIATQGTLFGNQDQGSVAAITNTRRFSYPGYNEIFTGAFDPRIDSNDYPPNPNVTVFEWLARKPAYKGKVAAIATWDAFRRIFNRERAGFDVIDSWDEPFRGAMASTPRAAMINEWYRTSVRMWENNTFDAPMHAATKEYIRQKKPRVLFVGYGETDEWAHAGMYDMVLQSAHRVDGFIRDLWDTMQAMPEYRGSTTFVITTDHGRGSGATTWRDHGEDVDGAENIWIAVLGPDTPAGGEMRTTGRVTQSQVAATLAALLGEDYLTATPGAGAPLTSVLPPASRAARR